MLDKRFQNLYRIPSSRAAWHNYNKGMYFVTACTKKREHYFGEITGRKPTMVLSEIGQYADEQFRNVHNHYPYAEIPLWIVMPNHFHCVAIIDDTVETMCTSSLQQNRCPPVETVCTPSPDITPSPNRHRWKQEHVNTQMQKISLCRGRLSTVIGGLKRAVTC